MCVDVNYCDNTIRTGYIYELTGVTSYVERYKIKCKATYRMLFTAIVAPILPITIPNRAENKAKGTSFFNASLALSPIFLTAERNIRAGYT